MATKAGRWLVIADAQRARLIHAGLTEQGSPHLELRDEIQFDVEEHVHEHGRPSMLKGRSEHTHAADHDEKELLARRFAKQFADWLAKRLEEIEDPGITLFAPPAFLGLVRKELRPEVADRIAEEKADLTKVPLGELGKHKQVRAALGI